MGGVVVRRRYEVEFPSPAVHHVEVPKSYEPVFVTYDRSRIIGDVKNVELYDHRDSHGLPWVFSNTLCNKKDKIFILLNPNTIGLSPISIQPFLSNDKVYLFDNTYSGEYVRGTDSNVDPNDILIFPSNRLMTGHLRDISGMSNHFDCMRYLLRKLAGAPLYVPRNRVHKNEQPAVRYTVINDKIVLVPTRVFSLATVVGIGDLLLTRAMLDAKRTEFAYVNISPHLETLNLCRSDTPEYRRYLERFFKHLFKPPYYRVTEYQGAPCKSPLKLITEDSILPVKPELYNLMCSGEKLPYDYFTIMTKVRGIQYEEYLTYRDGIYAALRNLPAKVVVLGERELVQTKEYAVYLPGRVYSIYEDIMRYIPGAIDLTFPMTSGESTPDIDNIMQNCMYMREAICNFSVGHGGLFCMALSVGNTAAWIHTEGWSNLLEKHLEENQHRRLFTTDNPKDFITKVKAYKSYERPETFTATVHLGLGDIIYTRAMLDNTKYKKIIIKPRLKLIESLGKSQTYETHTIDLFKRFFPAPRYELVLDSNEDGPGMPMDIYRSAQDVYPIKPYYPDLLCEPTDIPEEEYIVIHTKVKGFMNYEYQRIKNRLFQILRQLPKSYRIVLMGERSIRNAPEWSKLWEIGGLYSIYDDCKKYIPDAIDLTEKEDLTITPMNMEKACYIMKYARAVITLGIGGNFCLASAVAGYHVGLIVPFDLYDIIYGGESVDNGFVTQDPNTFLVHVEQLGRAALGVKALDWFLDENGTSSFSTALSLGDQLLMLHMLENDIRVKRVNISVWNGLLRWHHNHDEETRLFHKNFVNLLAQSMTKPVNVTTKQYEYCATDQFPILGFDMTTKPNFPQLVQGRPDIRNYVVITSKVRSVDRAYFDSIKEEYFANLKKLSRKYKLVLIGEKHRLGGDNKIDSWNYCIYDDIMQSGLRLEDRTVEIGRVPRLNELIADATLMHYAKATFQIGNGGQYCLALSVNANLHAFLGPDYWLLRFGQLGMMHKWDWCLKHTHIGSFQKFLGIMRRL